MISSMSFRLALGAIDRNGLSAVGTSEDELGFADAELPNTFSLIDITLTLVQWYFFALIQEDF